MCSSEIKLLFLKKKPEKSPVADSPWSCLELALSDTQEFSGSISHESPSQPPAEDNNFDFSFIFFVTSKKNQVSGEGFREKKK